jgi:deoxyribonuclease-4
MELTPDFIENFYNVGCHISKQSTLLETVKQFPNTNPYQIFLNGPQNSRISVKDTDLAQAATYVQEHNLSVFIHAPYILNLANEFKKGEWQYTLFQKYLEVGVSLGAKGVVIHVAKHTKQPYSTAIENMRVNLEEFKQYASIGSPILLETPAGQGTETLKDMKEFCDFVKSFNDDRIRVCLDTCHVYACGHDPLLYLSTLKDDYSGMLKLVHYNDSQDCCGSCLDRHAYIGTGKIGLHKMTEIAHLCKSNGFPMIIE